jgi:hypothetical protein
MRYTTNIPATTHGSYHKASTADVENQIECIGVSCSENDCNYAQTQVRSSNSIFIQPVQVSSGNFWTREHETYLDDTPGSRLPLSSIDITTNITFRMLWSPSKGVVSPALIKVRAQTTSTGVTRGSIQNRIKSRWDAWPYVDNLNELQHQPLNVTSHVSTYGMNTTTRLAKPLPPQMSPCNAAIP